MAATVFTIDKAKKSSFNLIEEDKKGNQAVHDVITAMRANRRTGSAQAKTRAEVKATGRKPWKQKGTGRARAGGNASPIWRGGGVAFGPRARDYGKSVNRATRKLAFSKVLGERLKAEDVLTTETFAIEEGKTKKFVETMSTLTEAKKVLVIGKDFSEKTFLAGRNVKDVLLMSAQEVNVEQLLYYDKIVVTKDALEILAGRTK